MFTLSRCVELFARGRRGENGGRTNLSEQPLPPISCNAGDNCQPSLSLPVIMEMYPQLEEWKSLDVRLTHGVLFLLLLTCTTSVRTPLPTSNTIEFQP